MRQVRDERGLFALLRVDETTPWEDVRKAFRAAVRASHPDLHGDDPAAEQRAKALNAAWASVNTPGKWAAFVREPGSGGRDGRGFPRGGGGATSPALGRLRIQRQQRGSVGLQHWKLELDGRVVGSLENGGTRIVEVRPGRHRLRVFYGSTSSLPLQVDLGRRQELHLGCRQLESLRASLFSRRRSLVLELLDSRRFS